MKFYQRLWFKIPAAIILIMFGYGIYIATQMPPKQPVPVAKQEQKAPEKKEEKQGLKWDKAIEEATAELKNKEFHKFTKDVSITVDEKEKVVTMMAIMNDGLKKWVAMEYADTMIRRFSSWMAIYNKGLTSPTDDNYGSLFDEYKIQIGIAPASKQKDPDKWYYMQWIYPKMHTRQGPNWKEAQRKGE